VSLTHGGLETVTVACVLRFFAFVAFFAFFAFLCHVANVNGSYEQKVGMLVPASLLLYPSYIFLGTSTWPYNTGP
jgi:hypothetical protein